MAKPKTTAKLLLNSVDSQGNASLSTLGTRAAPKSRLTNWNITWGDGASYQGLGAPDPTLNHKFGSPGDYPANLSVFDNRGGFDSDMLIVRISPPAPNPAIPSITLLTPNNGAIGSSCIISGTNFGSSQGSSKVFFNGTLVTSITSWTATSITCLVPTGATTGQVTVVVNNETSNGVVYTVTGADSFDFFIAHPNDGGNDANPGTNSQPWATVAHAAGIVSAGQSVGIKPSTSLYTERLLTWPSGSSGNNVLISGTDPNNRPTYRAAADISNYVFHINGGCHDLTVRDIVVDYQNVPALGLGGRIEDSLRILLQNVRLTNCPNGINNADDPQLITIGGSDSVTDQVTMLDCEVDHNGDTIATNFQHGIYVLNCTNMIQDGCYVHHNGAYGTQYYWGSAPNNTVHNGAIVRNGRYTANGRSGVLISSCTNGQAYNNRFWGNGIGLLGSGGGGIRWGANSVSGGKCWYNTAYNNNGGGTQGNFWAGAESSGIEFRNNISRDGNPNYQNDGAGTIQDHNLNFGGTNTDPLFVDPTNADFHLQSGSPARGIGTPVAITVDADGNPRDPVAPDAGCFEFV